MCEMLSLDVYVMMVGDGLNDLDALEVVALVAMGNAHSDLLIPAIM